MRENAVYKTGRFVLFEVERFRHTERFLLMVIIEIVKAVILGVIQGITEWLPISSTGHMILFNSFWPMDPSQYSGGREFINLFFVVIQFGSILAVLVLYFHRLNPFSSRKTESEKKETISLWAKVLVAVIPAGV